MKHTEFENEIERAAFQADEALNGFALVSQLIALAILFAIFEIFFTQPGGSSAFRWWGAALGAICLFEIAAKHASRQGADREKRALRILTVTSFVFGLISLAGVVFLFPGQGNDEKILQAILTFAIAISAAITRHTIWIASLGAIGAGLPALGIQLLAQSDQSIAWLWPISIVSWLCVIGLSWLLQNSFQNRIEIAGQKELLLQSIEAKMRELDELRKLELASRKEAEAANQSKSRFLAHVSHDLRQPLHALNLLVETIPENSVTPATQAIVARIRDSLDMLTELFDSLLDLGLLNAGKVEVNLRPVSLEPILHLIKQEFEPLAQAQGIEIHQVSRNANVRTDHLILRRMILNLVSNAIKHAECDRIDIEVLQQGARFAIEIRDNGRGISREGQSRIFEEFTREPAREGEAMPHGLGLGLAIVQRLASVLDLKVELESRPGKGALFRIAGLEEVPETADQSLTTRPGTSESAHGLKVLVVDDDAEILAATHVLLESWGYEVSTQAGAHFIGGQAPPDVLICDYELREGKTGLDVIKQHREQFKATIPALLITGNSSQGVSDQANKMGIPVLRKPIRPAQLRSALLTLFSAAPKGDDMPENGP